jgi:hypothetical protein
MSPWFRLLVTGVAVALAFAGTGSSAVPARRVVVCMEYRGLVIYQAQVETNAIFARAHVRIDWRDRGNCPAEAVRIGVSETAPRSAPPDALAWAMPFEGVHIRVFLDRVQGRGALMAPHVLAYVMVHEITHLLQGTDYHSKLGIMKEHWDYSDFRLMTTASLAFTPFDIELIERGLEGRVRRAAASGRTPGSTAESCAKP